MSEVMKYPTYEVKTPLIALALRVAPDQTAPVPEPLVIITNRDLKVPATPAYIYWQKLPASKKFKFISLTEDASTSVFKNIEVHKTYIKAVFDPPSGTAAYKYTITIKFKGELYNSDTRIGPAGDKAVIRN